MRILLGLTLITLALFAWQAAGNVAAQVPPTPTAAPAPTATPASDNLGNPVDRYLPPILQGLVTGFLAIAAALIATRPVWKRLNQDRDKYEADREADAQRRDEEQFRFIVEQFSNDDAAKLAAAVNIQTFFQEKRFDRFRRQAVEILIGNLRVEQTEPVRKALMVALREGIFSLPPEGERLDLRGCNLKEAEWGPKGEGEAAVGMPLAGALLSGADTHLEKADLSEAQLQEAYLEEANLQEALLVGANLQGARLGGANLQGAELVGANLQRAWLEGASLRGASLRGANLQGAQLQGAYLIEANLQGAKLQRASLRGAQLQGAWLDEACILSLEGTNWREAIWDDDDRRILEERYGAPGEKEAASEPTAETHEDREA